MKRCLLIVSLVVLFPGCSQPKIPQDSFYRLAGPDAITSTDSGLGGVLVVPRFLSDGLLSERPVVYAFAASGEKLQQYNYHFWIESPARMLQDLTVDYLRKAEIAPTVVTPEFRVPAAFELIGKIKRLEQVRGIKPRAIVSLEFGLYRVDDGSLMFLRSYDKAIVLERDDVEEAVLAMSRAVGETLSALIRDLGAL